MEGVWNDIEYFEVLPEKKIETIPSTFLLAFIVQKKNPFLNVFSVIFSYWIMCMCTYYDDCVEELHNLNSCSYFFLYFQLSVFFLISSYLFYPFALSSFCCIIARDQRAFCFVFSVVDKIKSRHLSCYPFLAEMEKTTFKTFVHKPNDVKY